MSENQNLIPAYAFDGNGYFDGETMWQRIGGDVIEAPHSTTVCPWGEGEADPSVFYRYANGVWTTEKKPISAEELVGVIVPHTTMNQHDIEMRQLVQTFSETEGYRQVRGEDLSWSLEKIPEKTPEEIEAEELAKAKADRAKAVSEIVVEVDGMLFDGDETAQERMSRSIVSLQPGESITWVLADNTVAQVTREQLQQALRLAGEEQTKLWVVPYQAA